jgi:hypothetical protein
MGVSPYLLRGLRPQLTCPVRLPRYRVGLPRSGCFSREEGAAIPGWVATFAVDGGSVSELAGVASSAHRRGKRDDHRRGDHSSGWDLLASD